MPHPKDLTVRPQDLGFGRLFESIRDAVIVAEAGSGRIVLWNPAATKIFGYSRTEALDGLRVEAMVPEHLKARHQAGMARYYETGRGRYIDSLELLDLPAVRKTGEEIRIELSLSPIARAYVSAANDRFVLAIVRDVTDRKRAEEEVRRLNEDLERRVEERTARLEAALVDLKSNEQTLRESEERFRLLVEGAQDYAIFMLDPKGRIASWNTGAERLWGYSEDETRGRSFSIIYTPEDQRHGVPERELRAAAEEGRAQDERWHVRKDGTRLWASGVVTPLLDELGGLRGFAKVMRDSTERRRAEEALRMSEARFRTMIEQSPLSIQILSPDGRTVRVNRAWEKLWGVTLEGLGGYNLLEDRQLVERGIMPYIRRGFAGESTPIPPILYDPEETIPGKSSYKKPKRWVRAFIYPVKDEAGNVREVILIHEDITERKQAEEALREMREAERRRIARDLHDGVLQDLSYTAAATALIKRKVEGSGLQEDLQRVIDAVKRAAQGLRDAVDDLRLKEAHDHRPLPELLEPLVQKNRALARGSCEVKLKVEEGLPSAPLGKTATELLGILQEALTNVRRHSGAKNVWVTLKTQGSEVIAEVLDDGRGFEPETAPGVGLSSMHERAAVVGGKLKIESAAGRGTRVQLRVPAPRKG